MCRKIDNSLQSFRFKLFNLTARHLINVSNTVITTDAWIFTKIRPDERNEQAIVDYNVDYKRNTEPQSTEQKLF